MEQFSLEKYLENPSRKVVTRQGNPVRIICTDRKHTQNWPIVALESYGSGEFVLYADDKGRTDLANENIHDLFFADEEKCNKILNELKSYLKSTPKEQVEKDWKEIQDWYSQHFTNEKYNEEEELTEIQKTLEEDCDCYVNLYNDGKTREELREWIKAWCPRIIDLVRKEIEKENSEFKPKFTYNEKDYSELANKLIEFRNNTPLFSVSYRDGEGRKIILHYEKEILDLVRNEIEKENPYNGKKKQEWSEEDKHCVELLLPIIDSSSLIPKNRKKCKNFLQSLKPQSHWKPSEEQMNALDKAKNNPANYHDIRLGLQSLYNDLLKL